MAKTKEWRDDDDEGRPNFGRKAQQWFRRSVRAKLAGLQADDIDALVEWYGARSSEFVRWEDSDEFRGRGWSCGSWAFNAKKVMQSLERAIVEVLEGRKANFPSLDEWLRDDIKNPHGTRQIVRPSRGSLKLSQKMHVTLSRKADATRNAWPRSCKCGREFRRGISGSRSKCNVCIAGN